MSVLVKNGQVATASDCFIGDIYIKDGVIKEVGKDLQVECDNIIDAKGKIVIPGGVDVHTHFNLHVGKFIAIDDFYTGTIAAACGGTTCIVDHIGFGPKGCDLQHQLRKYHEYADGKAVIDYSFHGVIQHVDESILHSMKDIVDEGTSSFKVYLTYDYKLDDSEVYRLLNRQKEAGGLITVHAENDDIVGYLRNFYKSQDKGAPIYHALSRPVECEAEAISRMINIARLAGNQSIYFVHLTNQLGLEFIKNAQEKGQNIYAETCPQYLLLSDEKYKLQGDEGLKYILSPPLRNEKNQAALWQGIKQGNIQVVATDHCPFSYEEDKKLGKDDFTKCPNGIPGVEERIPLLFSEGVMKKRISINKFVQVCCTNPAKIFGLYPKKGTIAPGSDGDLVIIDPNKRVTITSDKMHSNADYTPYEGLDLMGYPVMTISKGRVIAENGNFVGTKGSGEYIKRKKNNFY